VVFNTAEGTFEIKDTEGNLLKWESVEGTLTLNFKKTVTVKAGNEIILDAPKTIVTGDLIVGGTIVNGGGVSSSGGFMGKSFTEVDLDGPF
jgi:phage baseplate assembly protein gpV